jgi:hypothetical protein
LGVDQGGEHADEAKAEEDSAETRSEIFKEGRQEGPEESQ